MFSKYELPTLALTFTMEMPLGQVARVACPSALCVCDPARCVCVPRVSNRGLCRLAIQVAGRAMSRAWRRAPAATGVSQSTRWRPHSVFRVHRRRHHIDIMCDIIVAIPFAMILPS